VLVVDDDPLVLANTAAMLEDLYIRARSASDELRSRSASEIAHRQALRPDDHGSDYAADERHAACGRRAFGWPSLPVMIATDFAELPPGLDPSIPVLKKPFQQDVLSQTINACMGVREERRKVVAFRQRQG
jgi:hypothetical protein